MWALREYMDRRPRSVLARVPPEGANQPRSLTSVSASRPNPHVHAGREGATPPAPGTFPGSARPARMQWGARPGIVGMPGKGFGAGQHLARGPVRARVPPTGR